MNRRWAWILLPVLSACGGVKKEAKVATAIQTVMANAMTSFASKGDGLTVSYACGKVEEDGTLGYTIPDTASILSDPLKLIEFVRNNANGLTLDMTFSSCKIKACGDSIVLNGSGTMVFDVRPEDLASGSLDASSIPARFTLNVTNIPVTGLLSGQLTFSYIIEADYTTESLNSIEIYDTATPNPLVNDGVSYTDSAIESYSEGC